MTTEATPAQAELAKQAETKVDAKAAADVAVATDPHAIHGVQKTFKSPDVKASAATGALIGAAAGGPPGAVIGGLIGYAVEKYQIAGGPIGKLMGMLKRG